MAMQSAKPAAPTCPMTGAAQDGASGATAAPWATMGGPEWCGRDPMASLVLPPILRFGRELPRAARARVA